MIPARITSFAVAAALSFHAAAQTCTTTQLSFAPGGGPLNSGSLGPRVSADGRFVAFVSAADNTGLTPEHYEVYILDRTSGVLELVSQSSSGQAASHNQTIVQPYIEALQVSPDGRFVLFTSDSDNLVDNDTNTPPPNEVQLFGSDVFLRDRATGTTLTPNRMPDGTTGAGYCRGGAMSSDGRWIAFSTTNQLVAADTNTHFDAYLFDRTTGAVTLAGLNSIGAIPNAEVIVGGMSDDGRYVVLHATANDMLPGDSNSKRDVFVRDLVTGTVELVSQNSQGVQSNQDSGGGSISPDGRFVLFESNATNWSNDPYALTDVFVRDRVAGTTTLASARANGTQVNGILGEPDMSADGRYVVFASAALAILPDDIYQKNDVFLRDLWTSQTTAVSVTPSGTFSAAHSDSPDISADGRFIVFDSKSSILTDPPIHDFLSDIFLRECVQSAPTVYCVAPGTVNGCAATISSTGTPSASAGTGFDVLLTSAPNQRAGLLFYGRNGSTVVPFYGNWLCVSAPLTRTPLQNSGGSAIGVDCTGSFDIDFNARIAAGVDPYLVAGVEVCAQYWLRDSGSASGTHMSNAIWFAILP